MHKFIIVAGNLSDGFVFHGPYDSFDDADEASRQFDDNTWIATLEPGPAVEPAGMQEG